MTIRFASTPKAALKGADTLILAAPRALWKAGFRGGLDGDADLERLGVRAAATEPGGLGRVLETLGGPGRIVAIVLPDTVSRHLAPAASEALWTALGKVDLSVGGGKVAAILGLSDPGSLAPLAVAFGRRLPLYDARSKKSSISAALAAVDGAGEPQSVPKRVREVVEATRWAARLVDMPAEELDTAVFVKETKKLLRGLDKVKTSTIVGDKLLEAGLGGLHAVGRCAVTAPRLLVLDHRPAKAERTLAIVGKGVVYDTGGLSLKSKTGMPGMKGDMGGAAAVAAAFRVLAATGCKDRVVAAIPLAENAIGPKAFRNDDILRMHSGHTVEINNTDAEGRLLLGDAVSWAVRKHRPEIVVDCATLTGAQLVATGVAHAAVVSSRSEWEERAVLAGRASGDTVHALPFAPELYQAEFASKVADMRNSVGNRSNAQSSCAAQFIWAQIDDLDPAWLHVDLAGPAFRDGRGTGFGVALLSELLG